MIGMSLCFTFASADSGQIENTVPKYGDIKVEFVEKAIVKESAEDPNFMFSEYIGDVVPDKNGNVFLLDRDRILQYDNQGIFVKAFGKKGEGPGEYQWPINIFIHDQGDVYVNDRGRILHVFDRDGKFLRRINLNFSIPIEESRFYVDKNENIFALKREMSESGLDKVLVKADKSGTIQKSLMAAKDRETQVKSSGGVGGVMGGIIHPYSERMLICPIQDAFVCYGNNLKYELNIFDLDGNLKMIISKRESASSISEEEKRKFGKEAVFPAHRPFYSKILSDEEGRIYVIRTKSVLDNNPKTVIDIFGSSGQYLYRTEVSFKPVAIMNGSFYSIEQDENQMRTVKKWTMNNYRELKNK